MADALRVQRLGVQRGGRTLLDDVSLHAQHGALLAIAGPNGAGKSTLIKAVLGLLPHSGTVQVGAADIASLPAAERARAIAYVPQRSALVAAMSVRDVIAQARYVHRTRFGRTDHSDAAIERALEQTDLGALAQRSFATLSGGEQRRVLLARALATEARVLVFDEPTAGLDVAHVLRFFALATRLKAAGHALVCVLHDLGDVRRNADTALLLDAGRSIGFGAVAEVISPENITRVYGVHVHERAALGFSLDGTVR